MACLCSMKLRGAKEAMLTNGATALIRSLEDLGVSQVFGLPGVQNIEIYDALFASNIKHILVRHEQAAVHMADAYARVTGKVGVVLATSGPGATNTVTGLATAYMDSMPVVVITGQVPTTAIGTDAFQEADITTITLPVTKHSYLIKEVDDLVPAVFEAFYLATSGRPGPVLIDVPGNVAAAETSYKAPKTAPSLPSYKPTIKGNARQIKAAAELIKQAKKLCVLAGGGVVSSGAIEELHRLVRYRQPLVVTTMLAKGVMSHNEAAYAGQAGVYGAPRANEALQEADVLIAVGTRFSERVTANADEFAPKAKIIHIDIDPAEIGKNVRADIPIVGDAATVLAALNERLVPQKDEELETIPSYGSKALADGALVQNLTHITFNALADALAKHEDYIVTTDVGQHQLWASHLLEIDRPRRFITSGGLGTMGFGLPAALGAQVASPESLVLCISGDGSYQMSLQEMATAAVQKLPIKVAIINNQSHGLVHQWQEIYLEQRYAHTEISPVPDYVKLAEAYGWQGRTISADTQKNSSFPESAQYRHDTSLENKTRITEAFDWLLNTEGPALLEVLVPLDDLLLPMVKSGGSLTEVIS